MDGIPLKFTEEITKLPPGASKFMGNPDVWDGFEWPYFSENGEDYDLTFICQIDCAEAAPLDAGGLLPKTGLLYFFYDLDGLPPASSDKSAARVLYYGGDPASLHPMLLTDHEGNDMSFREMKIRFDPCGGCGEPYQGRLGATAARGWQPILQVYSFETDRVSLKFTDKSALCFFVDRPRLERGDFSEIHIRQI